jgi:endonuclease/exonuclease/phosphatase family metal-dependent hydrolase
MRARVVGALCALLVGGLTAPASAATTTAAAAVPTGYPIWELQLNLCDSGIASCYDGGQSIPEAASVIASFWPDLVTLNEVCKSDVQNQLFPEMQRAWSGQQVFWAFVPAWDESTNAPYLCTNGDQYGIGLVGHLIGGATGTVTTTSGHYPDAIQDGGKEARAWLCAQAAGQFDLCTTHLSKNGSTAIKQYQYLMNTVVPGVPGHDEMIVGGDINLKYGQSPGAQDCVPSGWFRKGDGDVQHVLATGNFRFDFSEKIGMRHTDHPGWLVAIDAP